MPDRTSHRKDDTFRMGQWLRGRLYERRSDLSPDGTFLITFAVNAQAGAPVGKGCYWGEHELVHAENGTVLPHPDRE